MKIIFSRKGFDSSAGGCASPIIDGKRLLSLPIPFPKHADGRRFGEVRFGNVSLGEIVEARTKGFHSRQSLCHLDPDLRRDSLTERHPEWRPLFGQADKAARHLEAEGVGPGDLFLFFGWFRRCDAWSMHARGSRDLHVLFGWLQVKEVIREPTVWALTHAWAKGHPYTDGDWWEEGSNRIYVGSDDLVIGASRLRGLGAGVFDSFHEDLQLTHPSREYGRSTWRLPACFCPREGRRSITAIGKGQWTVEEDYVRAEPSGKRWQEAVYDAEADPIARQWALDLITKHGRSSAGVR